METCYARFLHSFPKRLRPLPSAGGLLVGMRKIDYNNRPTNAISFMTAITSTPESLLSEVVRLLFLQEAFLQLAQRGQFHFLRRAFSSQLKSKVGNILTKAAALRITLEYRRCTCSF